MVHIYQPCVLEPGGILLPRYFKVIYSEMFYIISLLLICTVTRCKTWLLYKLFATLCKWHPTKSIEILFFDYFKVTRYFVGSRSTRQRAFPLWLLQTWYLQCNCCCVSISARCVRWPMLLLGVSFVNINSLLDDQVHETLKVYSLDLIIYVRIVRSSRRLKRNCSVLIYV